MVVQPSLIISQAHLTYQGSDGCCSPAWSSLPLVQALTLMSGSSGLTSSVALKFSYQSCSQPWFLCVPGMLWPSLAQPTPILTFPRRCCSLAWPFQPPDLGLMRTRGCCGPTLADTQPSFSHSRFCGLASLAHSQTQLTNILIAIVAWPTWAARKP